MEGWAPPPHLEGQCGDALLRITCFTPCRVGRQQGFRSTGTRCFVGRGPSVKNPQSPRPKTRPSAGTPTVALAKRMEYPRRTPADRGPIRGYRASTSNSMIGETPARARFPPSGSPAGTAASTAATPIRTPPERRTGRSKAMRAPAVVFTNSSTGVAPAAALASTRSRGPPRSTRSRSSPTANSSPGSVGASLQAKRPPSARNIASADALSGAVAARMHSAHAMTVSRGDTNLMLHSFAAKLANGGSDESKANFNPSQDG